MIGIAEEVAKALATAGGVVALETTLVAHGFPPGEGVAVGLESRAARARGGAVPATIGVLDGGSSSGSTEDELARFDADARKVGPRDLGAAARRRAPSVRRPSAARSPSAARPASASWRRAASAASTAASPSRPDVSADLAELARTPALVVSLRGQVAARRPGDARAARDARRAGARLADGRAAALLRRPRRAAGVRRASRRPSEAARVAARALGARRAAVSCSRGRRTRASTTSSR